MEHHADLTRFEAKVRPGKNGCWEWLGGKKGRGYGAFYMHGALRGAHRAALLLYKGLALDTPLDAMHSCDNPSCVNPDHLSYGSRTDNMRDAARKGRTRNVCDWRGDKNPRAKLSRQQRAEMESAIRNGESNRSLSDRYGITITRVQQIANQVKRAKKDGGGWALEEF